jgi:hypothetical protein
MNRSILLGVVSTAVALSAGVSALAQTKDKDDERIRLRYEYEIQQAQPRPMPRPPRPPRVAEQDGPEHVVRDVKTINIGPNGELLLSNVAGDIIVTGGGGRDAKVEIVKRTRNRDEAEARKHLDRVDVQVIEGAGRAEVRTVYPRTEYMRDRRHARGTHVAVDYTVTMPLGARITVKSISGNVQIKNTKGEVRAESVSGDIRVDMAQRLFLAKSVSGDVEISSATGDTELNAESISGRVIARGVKARTLDLGTISGDLVLNDVTCERANVRSISGSLDYAGQISKSGRYELKSHSGNVRLLLLSPGGFELDANSFTGNIRSDLPITLRGVPKEEPPRGHRGIGRKIQGVHGDGSAFVEITTFSGDIVILKK